MASERRARPPPMGGAGLGNGAPMVGEAGVLGNQAGALPGMWTCGGRRRRRVLGAVFLVLLAAVVVRRYYPCLPVVSEACGDDVVQRLNLTDLVPMRLRGRILGLQAKDSQFVLEQRPFRILGGSVHYFRVPREYWKDRLMKMKACGLNTLTTYVPWNLHEAVRGTFDFSGNLDLQAFIKTAEEVGLWVILRPGPYICSEWDLGGLPSWLLQDPEMQLRTTYRGFTEAVDNYFDHLMPQVVPLQYKYGGPIIAVQVENEYGSYAQDPSYMNYIKMALLSRKIVELLMTSDNHEGLASGIVEGALATLNFQKLDPAIMLFLNTGQYSMPKMVMEYWTGWFDSWGELHHVFDADDMVQTVGKVVKMGASINLYMFHGGTNFGFLNGAQHFQEYKPTITSYDYDAVLTESGDYTSKFFKLRQLFTEMLGTPLPVPPVISNKASYGAILMQQYVSLWEVLPSLVKPFKSEHPINMENVPVNDGNGQAFGYTLYETVIPGGGTLYSHDHVRDRAQVFVNTQCTGHLDYNTQQLAIPNGEGYRKLRLLVENCGRVNYGEHLNDQRKGLIGDISLNKTSLRNFKIYSLEMKPSFMESLRGFTPWSAVPDSAVGPAFFRGTLQVQHSPQDTFLKLEGWEKGVVFVNGQNLGRYWKIGPQETLYLPGTWLQEGYNEIVIFEERAAGRIIQSTDLPFLGKIQYVS
ncbi:beta-galactosidase-1-like protein 2 isoform X2 [Sceloporus undulatus]|uniref:beta-galactosidase-1-like protein 2 isoform X2 n=1 Tax=Sceloporus undulatus TaxID=8520 RepID=UPI001C4BB926|nr:beta-galactosidase-1-like protein 2 isoform X2 [Sceloporus undulatus]